MLMALLSAPLTPEQLEHMKSGGDWVPFTLFSPPAGVISVSMMDPQIYTFQYPPGQEHYRLGCWCNGFGVGHTYGGTFYGYTDGDASYYSLTNLGSGYGTWGPSVYQWWTRTQTTDGRIEVYQQYSYCPSVGALRGRATIRNLTGYTLTGVKFKRYIDWDMNPGYFVNNYFYWDAGNSMCYAVANSWAHYAGLTGITPTSTYALYGWSYYYTYNTTIDYTSYTGDGYCLLDWYIGNLGPYASVDINYCYVAGNSYSALVSARALCGTCPLASDGELGVDEGNSIKNPSFEYSNGFIVVRNYSGDITIYRLDGSIYAKGKFKDGDRIRVNKGAYIIKIDGATFRVVAK
ncbi:MAG: hypothetical protein ABIL17_01010 [candidate division WOR-3 bacterium]